MQNHHVAADSYYFQPVRHSSSILPCSACILYSVCLDLDFGSFCLLDSTPRLPRLVGGRVAGARADRQLVAVVEGGGTEALVLTAAGEVASAKQSNQSAKWNNHKDSQTAKRCKIHQVPSHFKTKFQVQWQRPVGVVTDWGVCKPQAESPKQTNDNKGGPKNNESLDQEHPTLIHNPLRLLLSVVAQYFTCLHDTR